MIWELVGGTKASVLQRITGVKPCCSLFSATTGSSLIIAFMGDGRDWSVATAGIHFLTEKH